MLKLITAYLAAAVSVASAFGAAGVAQSAEPAQFAPAQLQSGLSATAQLLQLMDTNKDGKVSKEEFMRFMEAEFDYADKDKSGELDPKELKRLLYSFSHPGKGPGR